MVDKSPLPDTWNVPQILRHRLRESIGRQRAMFAEGHLLLILHEPPTADETHREGRFFWRSPDGDWKSDKLGPGIASIRKHLAEYNDALQRLDRAEEAAEMADDYFQILREITPLRRAAGNMYHAFEQARQVVPEAHDLIVCRDQAYQTHRAAELLQSDMKIGLDCAIARRAEEEAQSSQKMAVAAHRLNVLAAIFFPIATIATIFGMNLASGLEEIFTPWLFWLVLTGCIACGLLLSAAVTGRPNRSNAVDAAGRRQPVEAGRRSQSRRVFDRQSSGRGSLQERRSS